MSAQKFAPSSRRPQQKCTSLENYFLKEQWDYIGNPDVSNKVKVSTMGMWLWRLGITCPSEQTLKLAIAILQSAGISGEVSPPVLQQHAHRLRFTIKQKEKMEHYHLSHIQCYPTSPLDLPAQMLTFAFDAERPVVADLEGLDYVAHSIGYRKTHQSLRGALPQPTAGMAAVRLPLQTSLAVPAPVTVCVVVCVCGGS